MTYMGSKRRYAKYLIPIINNYIKENHIKNFIDCFCGGANLADKVNCENVICNDLSPTLIALHQQAQKDFSQIPEDGSREYWDAAYKEWKNMKAAMDGKQEDIKTEMPLWKIGAIEWYASFANGGFPRGYAKNAKGRNYYQEAYRNHQKQSLSPEYQKITFQQGDYRNILKNFKGDLGETVLYCDSPYKGTKPYAIDKKFDFEAYYNWLRETSKIVPIFISEQEMPKDFPIIWEKEVKRTAGQDNNFKATEKLYLIDNRNLKDKE